jgi:hypothetical protein
MEAGVIGSKRRRRSPDVLGAAVKKAISPPGPGLAGIGRIAAVLSLGRIVLINVLALAVAAVGALHVYNRERAPRPAPLVRGILAAHPTTTASGATPTIDVDLERADPGGSVRDPASPSVNTQVRP